MTPTYQQYYARYRGEEAGPGVVGDCFSAALASLLDLPLSDVPHFAKQADGDGEKFWYLVNQFLASKGLVLIQTIGTSFCQPRLLGAAPCYHLILAQDEDGDGHTLVGLNGRVVFDPNPSKPMLVTDPREFIFGFLVQAANLDRGR